MFVKFRLMNLNEITDFSRLRVRDQKEKRNTSSSSNEFRVE